METRSKRVLPPSSLTLRSKSKAQADPPAEEERPTKRTKSVDTPVKEKVATPAKAKKAATPAKAKKAATPSKAKATKVIDLEEEEETETVDVPATEPVVAPVAPAEKAKEDVTPAKETTTTNNKTTDNKTTDKKEVTPKETPKKSETTTTTVSKDTTPSTSTPTPTPTPMETEKTTTTNNTDNKDKKDSKKRKGEQVQVRGKPKSGKGWKVPAPKKTADFKVDYKASLEEKRRLQAIRKMERETKEESDKQKQEARLRQREQQRAKEDKERHKGVVVKPSDDMKKLKKAKNKQMRLLNKVNLVSVAAKNFYKPTQ